MKTVDIVYRYEASDTSARPLPKDSSAALLRLNGGNSDFAALLDHVNDESGIQRIIPVDPRDLGFGSDVAGTPEQRPFAAVLGCSDARVPIELIFHEGPNDLFVVRVAGNGLGLEVLGSLKYAVDNLGGTLKLIVVLGHSGCGALTAAVDVFLNPGDYLTIAAKHSIRNILDRSLIVVQASANKLLSAFGPSVTRNPGYRRALIEASIVTNAAFSAYSIQQDSITQDLPELQVVYGVYVLETREVWAPRSGNTKGTGLASPPRDVAEFAEFADAVVRSERIASYIGHRDRPQRGDAGGSGKRATRVVRPCVDAATARPAHSKPQIQSDRRIMVRVQSIDRPRFRRPHASCEFAALSPSSRPRVDRFAPLQAS